MQGRGGLEFHIRILKNDFLKEKILWKYKDQISLFAMNTKVTYKALMVWFNFSQLPFSQWDSWGYLLGFKAFYHHPKNVNIIQSLFKYIKYLSI